MAGNVSPVTWPIEVGDIGHVLHDLAGWQPAKLDSKKSNEHGAQPEGGHGDADVAEEGEERVTERITAQGGEDPQWQANQLGHEIGNTTEQKRSGCARDDRLQHRIAIIAHAKVQMKGSSQPAPVLLDHRFVQMVAQN